MEFKKTIQIIFLLAILVGLSNCKKSNGDRFYDRKYVKEIKRPARRSFFTCRGTLCRAVRLPLPKTES